MENSNVENRRSFLKKMAYSAPVLVGLGSLTMPKDANAFRITNGAGSVVMQIEGGGSFGGHNWHFINRPDEAQATGLSKGALSGNAVFTAQETPFGGSIRR